MSSKSTLLAVTFMTSLFVSASSMAASISVCTAQCDTPVMYQEITSGGKSSGGARTVTGKQTAVVQSVSDSVPQAFEKLTKKCNGDLYISKADAGQTPYVKANAENACDHD